MSSSANSSATATATATSKDVSFSSTASSSSGKGKKRECIICLSKKTTNKPCASCKKPICKSCTEQCIEAAEITRAETKARLSSASSTSSDQLNPCPHCRKETLPLTGKKREKTVNPPNVDMASADLAYALQLQELEGHAQGNQNMEAVLRNERDNGQGRQRLGSLPPIADDPEFGQRRRMRRRRQRSCCSKCCCIFWIFLLVLSLGAFIFSFIFFQMDLTDSNEFLIDLQESLKTYQLLLHLGTGGLMIISVLFACCAWKC